MILRNDGLSGLVAGEVLQSCVNGVFEPFLGFALDRAGGFHPPSAAWIIGGARVDGRRGVHGRVFVRGDVEAWLNEFSTGWRLTHTYDEDWNDDRLHGIRKVFPTLIFSQEADRFAFVMKGW